MKTPVIPYLDEIVIKTLNYFQKNPPKSIDLSKLSLPFVIGSGNAYNTGLILFGNQSAVFADESNFRSQISSYQPALKNNMITDAVIISASGEKDSVWEVQLAKENGLKTTLLTTKKFSSAAKIADVVYTYNSIDEPYTYNTSTYMGMILSATQEQTKNILYFVNKLVIPKQFNDYLGYAFIIPDEFSQICPMIDIKKDELFGPFVGVRAFSQGQARHAKFITRSEEELVISLTGSNEFYGLDNHRYTLTLPKQFKSASIMAISYYLIGLIQRAKPSYFKNNIEKYVSSYGPKAYGKNTPFDIIVPGSI